MTRKWKSEIWALVLVLGFVAVPFVCFFLGVVAADILPRPRSIAWLITPWCVGLVYVGIGLYVLRRSARLIYGLAEALAAVVLIAVTMVQALDQFGRHVPNEIIPRQHDIAGLLQVAAALYVLVRGLDNIGEGLKAYPSALRKWNAVFPIDLWTKISALDKTSGK